MWLIKLHHMFDLHVHRYIKKDHQRILLTPTNLQTRLGPIEAYLKFQLQFHLPSRYIKLHWLDCYRADQITLPQNLIRQSFFCLIFKKSETVYKGTHFLCLVNLSNFLNRHLTVRPAHTLLLTGLMGRHYESENRSTPSLITHTSPPWRHDACSIDGPIRKVSVDREQLPYLPHDAHSNQRYDGNISCSGLCMGCSFKTPPVLCRLWMNRFVSNTHLHVVIV